MGLRWTLGLLIISASISSLLMVGCDRQRKFDEVPPNSPTTQSNPDFQTQEREPR